ncbi:MAG: hypothetical protein QXL54_04065 [Candidatus Bathyarchaeia archaeon]
MTTKAKTSTAAVVYLQLTSLEAFIAELKRRGISEAGLSDRIQRREMFERRKFRVTALDLYHGLILRYESIYYQGLAVDGETEELKKSREEARKRIAERLEAEGIRLLEGEYHAGRAEW